MTETLVWNVGGQTVDLSVRPQKWLRDVAGRGMPPVDVRERANRAGSGSVLEQIRDAARTVDVPVLVTGELRSNLRNLVGLFDPNVEGTLVSTVDSVQRRLRCRYVGGFEWIERLPNVQNALISFRAFDPFWEDVDPNVVEVSRGSTGTWLPWEMTVSPIRTLPDVVFAEVSIVNNGDVQAWPVWTLTGPFTSVTLENVGTGEMLIVDFVASSGDILTIDTRPGVKTVTDQDGVSKFSALDAQFDRFFSFQPGNSTINVTLAGSDNDSSVLLSWRRRWRSA